MKQAGRASEIFLGCVLFSNFCIFRRDENEVDFSFHVTFTKRAKIVNIFTIA